MFTNGFKTEDCHQNSHYSWSKTGKGQQTAKIENYRWQRDLVDFRVGYRKDRFSLRKPALYQSELAQLR